MIRNYTGIKLTIFSCAVILVFAAQGSILAADWSYFRKVTVQNPSVATTDAVVEVLLDKKSFDYAKAKADGSDLRFTVKSGDLNGTGLSYWIETWNIDGLSRIWLKLPKLAKGKTTLWMYYGNASAVPVADGGATFLFFDDFEDDDFSKKWFNTSIGEVLEKDGMLKLRESDGQIGAITANFEVSGKMIIRSRYQREGGDQHWTQAGIGGWNHWFCFGDHTHEAATGTNYAMIFEASSLNKVTTVPLVKVPNKQISAEWRPVAFWFDGGSLNGQQDEVAAGWTIAGGSSKLALRTLDNDSWDNFDFITVSRYLGPGIKVSPGEEQKF